MIHCVIKASFKSASVGASTANIGDSKWPAIKINYISNAKEQRHGHLVRDDREGKVGLSCQGLLLY